MADPAASHAIGAARDVASRLAGRSVEIEHNRTLPADIVADLAASGLLRTFVPASLGGAEASVQDGLTAIETLAAADGSTAWCAMIAMTTGLLGGFLPVEHARAVYGPPDSITGGFAAPMGRATVLPDGGLRITGRWAWGSGTRHCTFIGGGCRIVDEDGKPSRRADGLVAPFVLFDPADVELLDTWHVSGLKGTGSTDYQVTDAAVPEGRWVQPNIDPPREDGPLYRFSFFGMLAVGVAAVALGLAHRAVDEIVALAAEKRPQGSSRPLAERAPIQAEVAMAEAEVRSARALVADIVGHAWTSVSRGDPLLDDQRRLLRLAATNATLASARAVDRCYTAGGGAVIYEHSALQRVFRDVHVATQHAMVAPRTLELVGRLRLGLPTETGQL